MDRTQTPEDEIILSTLDNVGLPHKTITVVTGWGSEGFDAGRAVERALDDLRKKAFVVGADAVVGITVAHNPTFTETSTYHHVLATGTAVTLPWPAGHADPALGAEHRQEV